MATADLTRMSSHTPASAEADLYAEIARSWFWSKPKGEHIQRPMQRFVLGPDFAASVGRWPDSVYGHIIGACARVVSLENWELLAVEVPKPAASVGTPAREWCDPLTLEWYPLDGESELGVHFWRLGGGVIEVRSIGPFYQAPALQFGRFAAAERKLEQDVRRAVERMTRGRR